jgi:hypothetical protein
MTKAPKKQKMPEDAVLLENPLVVMFDDGSGHVITHLYAPEGKTHEDFGLLICDLVRHVARFFKVSENAVWMWVDLERKNPTTDITTHN